MKANSKNLCLAKTPSAYFFLRERPTERLRRSPPRCSFAMAQANAATGLWRVRRDGFTLDSLESPPGKADNHHC